MIPLSRFENTIKACTEDDQAERQLDALAIALHREGFSRAQIYNYFMAFLMLLQRTEREDQALSVEHVMDRIWGYCNPRRVLPLGDPGFLSDDDIQKASL